MVIQPGDIIVVAHTPEMGDRFQSAHLRTMVVRRLFEGRIFGRWISDGVEEYLPSNVRIENHWREDVSQEESAATT